MFALLKHRVIKKLKKIPLLQIFIYNNLNYFKFLFPHDKDYYALKLLFKTSETRAFADVGGNIGLSTIGFRELGFKKNKILIFEPDKNLIKSYLEVKKSYFNLKFIHLDYQIEITQQNYIKLIIKIFCFILIIVLAKSIYSKSY